MNDKFQDLNRQLAELSETINKFESEAVQLRIVELIFDQARSAPQLAEAEAPSYEAGPGRKAGANGAEGRGSADGRLLTSNRAPKPKPSASGAVAALAKLVDSDFFSEKRTIGDVVHKCEEEVGVRYKSNAFSGPLSRYARREVLKREKNAEGNYVYFK